MTAQFRLAFAAGALAATLAAEGAGIPKGAYAADDLDAACEEAIKDRKGLALLLADSKATNEKAVTATTAALRSLKSHSVIVYIEGKGGEMLNTPPPVVTALQDLTLGTFIPRFVVTSPDLLEIWSKAGTTAISGDDARKVFARVKGEVTEKSKSWKPGQAGGDPLQRVFKWGANENKVFEGRFDSLGDDKLMVFDKTGKKGGIELDKLTEASVAYAKKLQALADKAKAPSFPVEAWTSSDGRALKAKFVSLDKGKVTLELAGGKTASLPLGRLDAASAARAKDHAATVEAALAE